MYTYSTYLAYFPLTLPAQENKKLGRATYKKRVREKERQGLKKEVELGRGRERGGVKHRARERDLYMYMERQS